MKDDLADILFQSFLRETIVSSVGSGRDVHFLAFTTTTLPVERVQQPP